MAWHGMAWRGVAWRAWRAWRLALGGGERISVTLATGRAAACLSRGGGTLTFVATAASVIAGLGKTLPQSPKGWLAVMGTERCSQR